MPKKPHPGRRGSPVSLAPPLTMDQAVDAIYLVGGPGWTTVAAVAGAANRIGG
jgi:hypothetical protein